MEKKFELVLDNKMILHPPALVLDRSKNFNSILFFKVSISLPAVVILTPHEERPLAVGQDKVLLIREEGHGARATEILLGSEASLF